MEYAQKNEKKIANMGLLIRQALSRYGTVMDWKLGHRLRRMRENPFVETGYKVKIRNNLQRN
jgi:hypothetical protein